jgi:hypothetical protein
MAKPFARPIVVVLLIAALVQVACGALLPTPTKAPPPTAPVISTAAPPPPAATPTTASPASAEAGPALVTGKFTYTNDIITTYYVEHAAALVDMYGFV